MKELLKKYGITDYGFVDFNSLKTFNVRSISRIPSGCRTAVAMIFPYYNREAFKGNISAYCSVEDYHIVVGDLLKKICREAREKWPEYSFEPFVDSSPIDEVDMCVKAGLGVRGVNSLLISPKYGSYIFIGEILTDMELPTEDRTHTGCLNCGRCVAACPGKAISENGVDRARCASFISQKKGELTREEEQILRSAGTVFGCDICQKVCPMNRKAEAFSNLFSENIINLVTEENVEGLYKKRAFGFRGLKVLKRNLEIYNSEK